MDTEITTICSKTNGRNTGLPKGCCCWALQYSVLNIRSWEMKSSWNYLQGLSMSLLEQSKQEGEKRSAGEQKREKTLRSWLILHWLPFRTGTNLQNFQFWPKIGWYFCYLWHRYAKRFSKNITVTFSFIYHNMTYIGLYWHTSRYKYCEGWSITRIDCLEFLCWMGLLCCNTIKIYEELLVIPVSKKKKKDGQGTGKRWGEALGGWSMRSESKPRFSLFLR